MGWLSAASIALSTVWLSAIRVRQPAIDQIINHEQKRPVRATRTIPALPP
jgi:hypothetical protein